MRRAFHGGNRGSNPLGDAYLLRHLDVRSLEQALAILTKYYPLERFPHKTLYALEELLSKKG